MVEHTCFCAIEPGQRGAYRAAVARLLKPGGRLVYCTCSLEPEEGEMQIAALLRRNPDLERLPIRPEEIGGLTDMITPEGDLLDVCGSTDTGDLKYYFNRPRLQGDLHGFGSYLLAGAEIVRMEKMRSKASAR